MATKRVVVTIPASPAVTYEIIIGSGVLGELGTKLTSLLNPRRVTVITNDIVWETSGAQLTNSLDRAGIDFDLISIPDGEAYKTIETAGVILTALADCGAGRSDPIIAFGGGVIGDVAGFTAATYMRGVPFINVPTTLLAMADSSIGGKTAVDMAAGKNLVGAFHQPSLVISDLDLLATLPDRELAAGRAEMLKAAMLQGGEYLAAWRTGITRVIGGDLELTAELLERAVRFKADVVAADARDTTGRRAILNYGHTLGHALETALDYAQLGHGAAVSIGMAFAARLSEKAGVCDAELVRATEELLRQAVLPERPPALKAAEIIAIMELDKKNEGGEVTFVLLEDFGRAVVRTVSRDLILSTLEEFANG